MSDHLILSRQALREIDQRAMSEFSVPTIILMENAGRAIAEILLSFDIKDLVVICCGKGNNAGDGFVVARHLDNHHVPVRILLFADPDELTGDAKTNYEILIKSELFIKYFRPEDIKTDLSNELSQAVWIVDALFGTGLTGKVRAPFDRIIHLMNQSSKKILAVDIPSGLDCDTGQLLGAVINAACTVSLVAAKKGFSKPQARKFVGKLYVCDIGIPNKLIEQYRHSNNASIHTVDLTKMDERVFTKCFVGCVILTSDKKILLQQRGESWDHYPGYLCEFGGHIEESESPKQALIRELNEELGAIVDEADVINMGAITEASSNHTELIYVYFWFDKIGTITGCYEGECRYFDNANAVFSHNKITDGLRWLLTECKNRHLLE